MTSKLSRLCEAFIEAGWLAALIVVPLFFNVHSSRVFEPDKISLMRSIALLMAAAWLVKVINDGFWRAEARSGDRPEQGETETRPSLWRRIISTPLVLPTLLLVLAYLISTVFSLTPRISLLGSYQRLQGTYTTLSYILIFFMVLGHLRRPAQWRRLAYVIILTSRVHPSGKGNVVELRRRVSAAVGARFAPLGHPPETMVSTPTGTPAADDIAPAGRTRTGLDQLEAEGFARLRGRAVALVTNQTGINVDGRRGIDLLAAAPGVTLRAIFSPEHGLEGQLDAAVPHGRDGATGLPVWSLYGATRRPSAEMLAGIDTLVFDIQDVGARYYTYLTTLVYVLEEATRRRLSVVVLDRPNPITGLIIEGPLMDPDLRSFTAPHTIPVRPGMTIGEFALMVVSERKLAVDLTVVPLQNWQRGHWYDQTGLPWVNPSPNIRSLPEALLYSGIGLLEATNLSVGRGTDTPFEVIGAPWISAQDLADAMNEKGLAGIRFQSVYFTPSSSVYAGQGVAGLRMTVTDREALRPVTVALTLGRELVDRYPTQFRPEAIQNLLVNRNTMWSFLRGDPLHRTWSWAEAGRTSFLQRRASYLIYQ